MSANFKTLEPQRSGGLGKKLAVVAGVLVVLLVVVFFVVTSSAFVKGFILPKVGAAVGAKVEAESVALSPFSKIELMKVKVQTTGAEPLVTAERVVARYSLFDIIKGNIKVQELSLTAPVVQVVQEADGTSNLDPILKKLASGEKSSKPSGSSEPTQLLVENISLKNGTVRQITKSRDGSVQRAEIQNLEVALDKLGNNQSGKLTVQAGVAMSTTRPGGTNDSLAAKLSGGYDIALDKDLMPQTVKGALQLAVNEASGAYAQAAGLTTAIEADLTPTELRQAAVRLAKGTQALGLIRASGPLNLATQEGKLKVEMVSIDRNLLNLAGAGTDFRESTFNSTNEIEITQKGQVLNVAGALIGQKISVAQGTMVTPVLDLNVGYQVGVNLADQSATLQRLNVSAQQSAREIVRATLDQPMLVSWGTAAKAQSVPDAAIRLQVTNFNLAEWRAVVGTNIESGQLGVQGTLASAESGRTLKADFAGGVQSLSAATGTNRLSNATVTFSLKGTVQDMKTVDLPAFALAISQAGEAVLSASGSAKTDLSTKETTAQVQADAGLAKLLALAPVAGVSISSGKAQFKLAITESSGKRSATGNVGLAQFTGGLEPYRFENFGAGVDLDVQMEGPTATIRKMTAQFTQGTTPGGSFDVSGQLNTDTKAGRIAFKSDLNENTLRPILAPSLGENKLDSISFQANGEANLSAAENSIKADLKIANWVVSDKMGPKPALTLAASLDGGMKAEVLELRKVLLQLSPTPRARNELLAQGKIDFSTVKPGPSTLSVKSESLDLTQYYDMFAAKPSTTQPAAPAPTSPQPETEPAAMDLPIKQLTATLDIGRLYVRDVAVSNWTATTTISSNVVKLDPFKLTVNGAPVNMNARVDVGVPGYNYNVGFGATGIPVEPVVTALDTNKAGQIGGFMFADGQISGAGITGPNLKKNLGGKLAFNLTNLNYQVLGPKMRRIIVPIAFVLRVNEITNTPINWIGGQLDIGGGYVNVTKMDVQSEAFAAQAAGRITLENVLTNSTLDIPLEISLRRSLAQKASLLAAGTPEDAKYSSLPKFVTVKGTVGEPDPDINKLVIAGLIAKGAAGLGLNLGNETAGKALNLVGNVLGGGSSTNANTNTTATGILKGLLGGNKAAETNAPAGATNASPAKGLLDLFKKSDTKK